MRIKASAAGAATLQQAYLVVNELPATRASHVDDIMETRSLVQPERCRCLRERRPETIKTSQFSCASATCHAWNGQPWEKSSEMIDDNCWRLPFNSFPTNRNYYLYLRAASQPASARRSVTGDVRSGNRRLTECNSWLTADDLWSCWSLCVQPRYWHISPTALADHRIWRINSKCLSSFAWKMVQKFLLFYFPNSIRGDNLLDLCCKVTQGNCRYQTSPAMYNRTLNSIYFLHMNPINAELTSISYVHASKYIYLYRYHSNNSKCDAHFGNSSH